MYPSLDFTGGPPPYTLEEANGAAPQVSSDASLRLLQNELNALKLKESQRRLVRGILTYLNGIILGVVIGMFVMWAIFFIMYPHDKAPKKTHESDDCLDHGKVDRLLHWLVNNASEIKRLKADAELDRISLDRLRHWSVNNATEVKRLKADAKLDRISVDRIRQWADNNATEVRRLKANAELDRISVDRHRQWAVNNATEVKRLKATAELDRISMDRFRQWSVNNATEVKRLKATVKCEPARIPQDRLRSPFIRVKAC